MAFQNTIFTDKDIKFKHKEIEFKHTPHGVLLMFHMHRCNHQDLVVRPHFLKLKH